MDIFLYVIVLIGALAGYGVYQQQRERRLAERLKQMKDPNTAIGEVDAAIAQSHSDAEFFRCNSMHR